jgi:hypothetical protein
LLALDAAHGTVPQEGAASFLGSVFVNGKDRVSIMRKLTILGVAWAALAFAGSAGAQGRYAWTNGDTNGDGTIDLSDPIQLLNYLFFAGAEPAPLFCEDLTTVPVLENGDVNADGRLDVSDPIHLLSWLFRGGARPSETCANVELGSPELRGPGEGGGGAPKPKLDTPTITCVGETQVTISIQICAGPSGAPAGFSLQWQALPDGVNCDDFVWPASNDPDLCKASLSGVPGCTRYNLGPNECVTVKVGNLLDSECGVGLSNCGKGELVCGTEYVFRAFAHANKASQRSDFTGNLCCSTEECAGETCVRSQGYWRTHGPAGCNPSGGTNVWPEEELTIGGTTYSDAELCTNLNLPGAGNAVRILSHQLIAAMLNVASGATLPPSCDLDAASDLLIGHNINTSSVAPSSPDGQDMTAAADCLELYNTGDGGVSHCP